MANLESYKFTLPTPPTIYTVSKSQMMTRFVVMSTILALRYSVTAIHFDDADFLWRNSTDGAVATSTNTYAQAVNYGKTHPTRDGGSWSGWWDNFSKFPELLSVTY